MQRFGQSFGCVVELVGWWFDLLNDNVWCWCRTMLVVVVVVVVVVVCQGGRPTLVLASF